MMTKNRKIQLFLLIIALGLVFIGGTVAYFRAETQSDTPISTKSLDIALMEDSEILGQKEQIALQGITPKTSINKKYFVKNLESTPAYTRITITKYWQDKDNHKLPNKDASFIEIQTENSMDWIIQEDKQNQEILYMYYKKPLSQNTKTSAFINQIIIDKTGSAMTNEYTNLHIHIDIEVDAIQQYAAKEAIMSQWGLDANFDEKGNLIAIEE